MSKWHRLKIKCTVHLPPDDDSLNLHLKRTNYVAYCQIHYNLCEHPSPIGDGWELVNGKCRPVRYTFPPLPTRLTLQHYSDDCSSEDEISECGESTESDDEFEWLDVSLQTLMQVSGTRSMIKTLHRAPKASLI